MFFQLTDEIVGWEWTTDQIALDHIAMHGRQKIHLGKLFHPFGDDAKIQYFCQRDDAFNDGLLADIQGQVYDEGSVELEDVGRNLGQINQR